jgi:hypothetical protein
MIGDSVSNGYFQEADPKQNAPELLADVALTQHAPFSPGSGGAGPTSHGLDCLDVYLHTAAGELAHFDLITFNFGLHDLGNLTSDIATYEQQLTAITDRLLTSVSGNASAKLLYLMTTPMMPGCCGGGPLIPSSEGAPVPKCKAGATAVYPCDSVVQRLNVAAARIMATKQIATLDLHSVVTDICAPAAPHIYANCSMCRMEPCSFHYKPAGYDVIAKGIAGQVRAMLAGQH